MDPLCRLVNTVIVPIVPYPRTVTYRYLACVVPVLCLVKDLV